MLDCVTVGYFSEPPAVHNDQDDFLINHAITVLKPVSGAKVGKDRCWAFFHLCVAFWHVIGIFRSDKNFTNEKLKGIRVISHIAGPVVF